MVQSAWLCETKKRKEGCIMKKMLFIALTALLVTVPAWAAVNITATTTQVTVNSVLVDTDEIVITYENTEVNDIRAFAFDITVQDPCGDPAADAHIVAVNEGELNVDYWVYPGSIDINESGAVNDVGTFVADPCQLPSDTQGGLGTAGITVEMGSLYVGESNAPATSGVLLKLYVDDNCLVKMSDNVSRGGVVMEGVGSKVAPNYSGTSNSMYTATDIAYWRSVGKPKCFCRYKGGRQCKGDASSDRDGNALFGFWHVGATDLNVLTPNYEVKEPTHGAGILGTTTFNGSKNIPSICADIAHDLDGNALFGFWYIGASDLNILTPNYEVKEPTHGVGIPANCP
jgi:hypothetical protein